MDAFLQEYIVGLVALESGFDNNARSSAGAFGILQLMPSSITNSKINPKRYSQEAVESDFSKQIELAKNLMREDYTFLKRYTKPLADAYFEGNESDAKYFMIAPLVMNAYNTGGPNIKK